jgi:ketosteroid isomerase-like protein
VIRHHDPRVDAVIRLFESLRVDDVARLNSHYTADASFKDPFNEVQGLAAIQRIFSHMFDNLLAPHFVIVEAIAQDDQAFLSWEFHFRMKRFSSAHQVVRGGTHLRFAPDGRIAVHRDYWDAAEELYEKLPVLGALMRWLKRRANG